MKIETEEIRCPHCNALYADRTDTEQNPYDNTMVWCIPCHKIFRILGIVRYITTELGDINQ